MANAYASAADLIARSPSLASFDPVELDNALTAASRWIDGYCGRKFWLDPVATSRVLRAANLYVLDLGEHEIGSSTGVIVKTDSGAGTFATTVSASAYMLEPPNAPYSSAGPRPYTSIRGIGTSWPVASAYGRRELVQVTARYGWPEVPAPVREACLGVAVTAVENPTGVRAEAVDGYSVSYSRNALTDSGVSATLRAQLAPYRRSWAV